MMDTATKNYILDASVSERKMRRMAFEILENNIDENEIILAGISENGCVVASTIQKMMKEIAPVKTSMISISLDKKHPGEIKLSEIPDFNDKVIIIIDDVASSGKTLLYSLKPFLNYHPRRIQTLVLVERTHKAYPIKPDYVGVSIATTIQDHIYVEVNGDKVTGAYLQ